MECQDDEITFADDLFDIDGFNPFDFVEDEETNLW